MRSRWCSAVAQDEQRDHPTRISTASPTMHDATDLSGSRTLIAPLLSVVPARHSWLGAPRDTTVPAAFTAGMLLDSSSGSLGGVL